MSSSVPLILAPGLAETLGGLSLAGTLILGYLNWKKDKRKIDVDADTVAITTELAADESSVKQALLLRDEALKDRKDTRSEINDVKASNVRLNGKVDRVARDLREVKAQLDHTNFLWRQWYQDLHRRWEFHRLQEIPPDSPYSLVAYDDGQDMNHEDGS